MRELAAQPTEGEISPKPIEKPLITPKQSAYRITTVLQTVFRRSLLPSSPCGEFTSLVRGRQTLCQSFFAVISNAAQSMHLSKRHDIIHAACSNAIIKRESPGGLRRRGRVVSFFLTIRRS